MFVVFFPVHFVKIVRKKMFARFSEIVGNLFEIFYLLLGYEINHGLIKLKRTKVIFEYMDESL